MRVLPVLCVLLCFWVSPLYAAEKVGPLSEIVVTASAEAAPARQLPVSIQVIDEDTIEKSGAATLDKVLEKVLPGQLHKYPGNSVAVRLRGFRSNTSSGVDLGDQVLLLIDGHRAGTGNVALIPVGNVERVEVVRGPASALYGGSAMGGVINVITKRGAGDAHGKVGVKYGSNDYKAVEAEIVGGLNDDRFGYSFAGEFASALDYEDGRGSSYENTDYENVDVGATATYRPFKNHTLSAVGFRFAAYDNGSPGKMSSGGPKVARVSNTHDYLALEYDGKVFDDVSLKGSVFNAKHWYEYEGNSIYGERSIYETQTSGGRLQVGIPVWELGRLAVGGEYSHLEEEHRADGGSVYSPNAEYDLYGIFAEHKVDWNDFTFLMGARYDHYCEELKKTHSLDVKTGDENFSSVTWRGGVTWWALDWLSLRSAVGTAYTPPTAQQLAGKFTTGYGTYTGNPDLEAEKSLTYEVGLDLDKWDIAGGVTYFHTDYDQRIATITVTPYVAYEYDNIDGQELAGFEGYLRYATDVQLGINSPLTIAPHVNWEIMTTRSNTDSAKDGEIARFVPEYSATAGVDFTYDIVTLAFNGRFTGEQTIGANKHLGSFSTYDSRLTVAPTENLSMHLAVDNITDKQYGYVDGYPMPGRTYTVGLEYAF